MVNGQGGSFSKYKGHRWQKIWEEGRNLVSVLVKFLGQIGIGGVCLRVDILRLAGICSLWVYIVMGGWYYLPTPPLGQDMTQGQFLSEV